MSACPVSTRPVPSRPFSSRPVSFSYPVPCRANLQQEEDACCQPPGRRVAGGRLRAPGDGVNRPGDKEGSRGTRDDWQTLLGGQAREHFPRRRTRRARDSSRAPYQSAGDPPPRGIPAPPPFCRQVNSQCLQGSWQFLQGSNTPSFQGRPELVTGFSCSYHTSSYGPNALDLGTLRQ